MPLNGMEDGDHPQDAVKRWRRGLFRRMRESDEERLEAEIRDWAATVAGCSPIAEAPARTQVRVAGIVRRITMRPAEGSESVEAVLSDGTDEVTALWMGRRSIPGMSLGTRMVLEGVLAERKRPGPRKMVNPKFEFAA
ncbi:MAG: OB-fold nucleic acid binding domain-containing protein [Actinobacteria bacterium]|nr:OB-fold nucleic acid binding domain-containing protein [Actinomycetota bacterium]